MELLVVGHVDNSYWRDMGRPDDFVRGSSDLVRGSAHSPLLEGRTGACAAVHRKYPDLGTQNPRSRKSVPSAQAIATSRTGCPGLGI